jgi:hypothetical protein
MTAFLLPSRGVSGLSSFLALVDLTGLSFEPFAAGGAPVPLVVLRAFFVAVVDGSRGSACGAGTRL